MLLFSTGWSNSLLKQTEILWQLDNKSNGLIKYFICTLQQNHSWM
uniref:Uncharacterized protein n=1 Tax=Arundo donax TaxID=35708 RepID=A0A0A9APQ9_ARUDO